MDFIDRRPVKTRRISFRSYLALPDSERRKILRVRVASPKLDAPLSDPGQAFGAIEVEYKKPVWECQSPFGDKKARP